MMFTECVQSFNFEPILIFELEALILSSTFTWCELYLDRLNSSELFVRTDLRCGSAAEALLRGSPVSRDPSER